MSEKNLASTLATSLVPLGALAVVAGCGGGGGSAVAPPVAAGNTPGPSLGSNGFGGPTGPTVPAQLTITVPARGTQFAKRKTPQYISPGSGAVGVAIQVGSATPSPQQLFTLPTPGPAPITTTLPIKAVAGTDTITVNVYDVSPAATASPNLLSSGSTTTAISPTALNTPSVTTLGVPGGVVLSVANAPSPAPGNTARPWTPLENVSAAQSVTLNATAVDALGYTIAGALATAAPITATGPVTLSANSLTTATATVTATYPQNANTAGTIGSPLALNVSAPTNNVAVQPDYGVFVAGNTTSLAMIDGVDHSVTSLTVGTNGEYVAAASCGGGAVAAIPDSGQVDILTLAPSSAAHPVPAVSASSVAVSGLTSANGVVFDSACNAYVAVSGFTVYKITGLATGSPVATSFGTATATGFDTWLSIASPASVPTLFLGENGPFGGATYTMPLAVGGTATMLDGNSAETVATAGGTIYKLWNTYIFSPPACGFTGVDLQDYAGAQSVDTSTASTASQPVQVSGSTLYFNQPGNGFFAVPTPVTGTLPAAVANFTAPAAFALSPDPGNTYVCDANGTQVQFYPRSALSASQTPASVALTITPTGIAAAP